MNTRNLEELIVSDSIILLDWMMEIENAQRYIDGTCNTQDELDCSCREYIGDDPRCKIHGDLYDKYGEQEQQAREADWTNKAWGELTDSSEPANVGTATDLAYGQCDLDEWQKDWHDTYRSLLP